MASPTAIAKRRAKAFDDISTIVETINEQTGLSIAELRMSNRKAAERDAENLQILGAWLAGVSLHIEGMKHQLHDCQEAGKKQLTTIPSLDKTAKSKRKAKPKKKAS